MDKNSVFGEVLEKGQTAVTNAVTNTANNTANDISQTIAEQVGIAAKSQVQQSGQSQSSQATGAGDNIGGANPSEATREIVEDFYSPSDNVSSNNNQAPLQTSEPQTQAKLASVRKQLQNQHDEVYYDPLFSYENKKPEPSKADVIEQEESQKMQALAIEQQKKDGDIAKTRAQIAVEANRGVAG